MNIGFMALETFVPTKKYIEWSRLIQVKEVVSLDCSLCPSVIHIEDDDIEHLQQKESYYDIFNNLDWVLQRAKDVKDKQILAVLREPTKECKAIPFDSGFHFCGYDLVEDDTKISALTNCGGFDEAFLPSALSKYGLIEDFVEAKKVQLSLREKYPADDHAYCTLWAIWKMDLV
ncbi:MAG: hypothetical protein H6Q69_3245 [Firmicutes bacterium]|nr:hypothetical protein [Bacillota bacterium]